MAKKPIKKRISIDEQSLNILIDEIYNENKDLGIKLTTLSNKWETTIGKDVPNMVALGDQAIKIIQQKIMVHDKKIGIARLIKDSIIQNNRIEQSKGAGEADGEGESKELSADRQSQLRQLLDKSK